jgi:hypothetical protein
MTMVDLSHWDFSAIAESSDKLNEAIFFFDLASKEPERQRFRWLISAFFNAAYSFFETAALHAFHAYTNEDGDTEPDPQMLGVLRRYVLVNQNSKNPYRVDTAGKNEITRDLYDLRKRNTHHFPMSIMVVGPSLPQDYHFGFRINEGIPALPFCEEVLALIRQVQRELDAPSS